MLLLTLSFETEDSRRRFEDLYEKYLPKVYGLAFSILKNEEDAREAADEAFLAAAEKYDKLETRPEPEILSWLLTTVKYKAMDIFRARKRVEYIDEYPPDIPEPEYECDPQVEILYQAMKKLPAYYQDLLSMRLGQELGTDEIAKSLGKKRSAIQKDLWRATQMLKRIINKESERSEVKQHEDQ